VLEKFFLPKSIAVIGASNNPNKLGYDIFHNLKRYGGRVYPVNVKGGEVQGVKAYRSVREIPEKVDMCVVVVPKKFVKDAIRDSGESGCKAAVVITAGFRETGEEGRKEEEELVKLARSYGMRLIGPNCVGVMNLNVGLNATFIKKEPPEGDVALVSQSGALGGAIIYKSADEGIGLSKFVSVGNMADVDFADLIEYFADDSETKAISLYIEGVRDGRRFLDALKKGILKKPVIVLKAGRTSSGARAASSHTGSLAGSFKIYESAVKQSGGLMAKTIDEMLSMARAFKLPLPAGRNVAIITNAGGPAVLAADEVEERGLSLAKLSAETLSRLKEFLPPMAALKNPVDMIASATGEDYYKATKILLEDPNVDIIIAICVVPTFGGMSLTEHAEGVIKAYREMGMRKPVLAVFMSGEVSEPAEKLLGENGIPNYRRPEDAAAAAYALAKYSEHLKRLKDVVS